MDIVCDQECSELREKFEGTLFEKQHWNNMSEQLQQEMQVGGARQNSDNGSDI